MALTFLSAGRARAAQTLPEPGSPVVLREGWALRSAARVAADGAALSRPGFAAEGWYPARVPSTVLGTLVDHGVYSDPFFARNLESISTEPFQGSWWYRKEFELEAPGPGARTRLVFDGINYSADLWLNGRKLAGRDSVYGVWRTFDLDVTEFVRPGRNALAIEVFPPRRGDFTMGFVDWNPWPPDGNMGLFREVRLRRSGSVSLEDVFVQTSVDTETLREASLIITADLVNHGAEAASGTVSGRVAGVEFRTDYALALGERKSIRFSPEQFPELRLREPRLWWPRNMGKPELYTLTMRVTQGGVASDAQAVDFGIRQVGDYLDAQGRRGYTVNGQKVLIRGGGWSDDMFLREDEKNLEAQFRYIKHLNLNAIRLEGFWGSSQRLYELADRDGILVMAGFSCQWEWPEYLGKPQPDEKYGMAFEASERSLLSAYLRDQVRWLRNHPSIFVWLVGSDKMPAPEAETLYRADLAALDPSRPVLLSAGGWVSTVSGPSGVKMRGPYDYVTPNYWYVDTTRGGAYGFNTETSAGPEIPPLWSLKKMLGADHLWPIGPAWDFHCGRFSFGTLTAYMNAYRNRYGEARGVEEFAFKAQAANYETTRAMFEAFGARKPATTGIIQWMLNSAWPRLIWQLYDYFLMPNGAFYGARNGSRPVSVVYDYGEHAVSVVNETLVDLPNAAVRARLYDRDSRLVFEGGAKMPCLKNAAARALKLPPLAAKSPVYFLALELEPGDSRPPVRNFYWLSAKPDVLDFEKADWRVTPNQSFADLTALSSLPRAKVGFAGKLRSPGEYEVALTNASDKVAFFIELRLMRKRAKEPVLPVLWDDNYISLLPRESRAIMARFDETDLRGDKPALEWTGWNLKGP